jgi:hypothetical protein
LIGVNIAGHDAKRLKAVMDKEKLTWRSFADPGNIGEGAIAAKWNVAGTPTIYLIDHNGVIRYKWVGSPSEKVIDGALDQLIRAAEPRAATDRGSRPGKDSRRSVNA